jgi:hypothetical protein
MAYRKNGSMKYYVTCILCTCAALFVYNKWIAPMTQK